jgi:hypothetical protein
MPVSEKDIETINQRRAAEFAMAKQAAVEADVQQLEGTDSKLKNLREKRIRQQQDVAVYEGQLSDHPYPKVVKARTLSLDRRLVEVDAELPTIVKNRLLKYYKTLDTAVIDGSYVTTNDPDLYNRTQAAYFEQAIEEICAFIRPNLLLGKEALEHKALEDDLDPIPLKIPEGGATHLGCSEQCQNLRKAFEATVVSAREGYNLGGSLKGRYEFELGDVTGSITKSVMREAFRQIGVKLNMQENGKRSIDNNMLSPWFDEDVNNLGSKRFDYETSKAGLARARGEDIEACAGIMDLTNRRNHVVARLNTNMSPEEKAAAYMSAEEEMLPAAKAAEQKRDMAAGPKSERAKKAKVWADSVKNEEAPKAGIS